MARKLTPQRENFARHIVKGYDGAAAYRIAFVVGPKTKPQTTWNDAYKLMKIPEVRARIDELNAEAAKIAVIDRASMLSEMGTNRTVALGMGKVSVAESASFHRARVAGLLDREAPAPVLPGGEAAGAVATLTIEERSIFELGRRVAFTLELGRRRVVQIPAPVDKNTVDKNSA